MLCATSFLLTSGRSSADWAGRDPGCAAMACRISRQAGSVKLEQEEHGGSLGQGIRGIAEGDEWAADVGCAGWTVTIGVAIDSVARRRSRRNDFQVAHALYSVPHPLGCCEVDVRIKAHTAEIFHNHRRVAADLRIHRSGGYVTEPSQLGRKAGPHTAAFIKRLLESRLHPAQGYRSCLGFMSLLGAYSAERLEAACRHALEIGTLSCRSVNSILLTGRDQTAAAEQTNSPYPPSTPPSADPTTTPRLFDSTNADSTSQLQSSTPNTQSSYGPPLLHGDQHRRESPIGLAASVVGSAGMGSTRCRHD